MTSVRESWNGTAARVLVWVALASCLAAISPAGAQPGHEPGWDRFPPPFPEFRTNRSTELFERPSASARPVARLRSGVKVLVSALSDEWAEIRSTRGRPDAYVRRAVLTPLVGHWPRRPGRNRPVARAPA